MSHRDSKSGVNSDHDWIVLKMECSCPDRNVAQ